MLLVAIRDRKARVEVGYGLEPILPDALAGRVLDELLFPAFKQGRYAQGLTRPFPESPRLSSAGEPASAEDRRGGRGRSTSPPSCFWRFSSPSDSAASESPCVAASLFCDLGRWALAAFPCSWRGRHLGRPSRSCPCWRRSCSWLAGGRGTSSGRGSRPEERAVGLDVGGPRLEQRRRVRRRSVARVQRNSGAAGSAADAPAAAGPAEAGSRTGDRPLVASHVRPGNTFGKRTNCRMMS